MRFRGPIQALARALLVLLVGLGPDARAGERSTLERDGLRVEYPPGRARAAEAFGEIAQAQLSRIQAELGLDPACDQAAQADPRCGAGRPEAQRVRLGLAEDLAEMRALAPPGSRVPSWAAGLAFPAQGLVLLRLDSRVEDFQGLERILTHELAHLLLARATGFRPLPRWFQEGYAIHASGEWSAGRTAALAHGVLAKRLFSLEALSDSFPESPWEAELAYAQSIDFVNYLLGRAGYPAFHRLMALLEQGLPLAEALEEAYDIAFPGLEREWREDLARRTTWLSLLTGTGALWSLGALGLGAAFLRRRRARRLALELLGSEDPPPPPLTPWSP